jgi:predicted SAM-dependent methyltransferase
MKLHIGGESAKPGWKILNIQPKPSVDYIGDISDLSQFETNTFEEVYASHVFEHVMQKDILKTLEGIYRIIKHGGQLHISVPDMDKLCALYLNKELNFEQRWHVMRMIFGGQVDSFDFHYAGWNNESLSAYLNHAGFSQIIKVDFFGLFEDTSNFSPYGSPISLNITAVK